MSHFSPLRKAYNLLRTGYGVLCLSEEKKVLEQQLSCGATLITRRSPGREKASICVLIDGAGSASEDALGLPQGTAHFFEHTCLEQSASYGPGQAQTLVKETFNGYINAQTGHEHMAFVADVPIEHFNGIIPVIADCAIRPVFSQEVIECKRQEILVEWLMDNMDKPQKFFFGEIYAHALGNHPSTWPCIGTPDGIRGTRAEHLAAFCAARIRGPQSIIVVEGDIDPRAITDLCEKHFSFPSQPAQAESEIKHFHSGDTRVDRGGIGVRMALTLPAPQASNWFEFVKMRTLMNLLREKTEHNLKQRGQTYGLTLTPINRRHVSMNCLTNTAFANQIEGCLEEIGHQLDEATRSGYAKALKNHQEQVQRHHEQSASKEPQRGAMNLARDWHTVGRYVYHWEFNQTTQRLTPEDIKSAARTVLSGPYAFFAEGNTSHLPDRKQTAKLLGMPPAPESSSIPS